MRNNYNSPTVPQERKQINMKKIRKTCAFIVTLIITLQIVVPSFASGTINNPIIKMEEEKCLTYENNEQIPYRMLELNQQPVYRISSEEETSTNYISNNYTELENQEIINTIKFGYPSYSKEELNCETDFEAYIATQEAIYTIYNHRDFSKYQIRNEKGQRIYNAMEKILQNARTKTFQEELEINIIELNNELVEENQYYMAKEYKVTFNRPIMLGTILIESGEGIQVSKREIHGNDNIKILIPKNVLSQNINVRLIAYIQNFNMKLATNTQTPQNKGQIYLEPTYSSMEHKINIKTGGSFSTIKIVNINKATNTPIYGNKFQLLDEDLNIVRDNLTTDREGKIKLENIAKGKYYLKQTEVVDGYCINKTNIMIEVSGHERIINVKVVSDTKKKQKTETLEQEIILNEENKDIEAINNKEITKINTSNIYKDITNNQHIKEENIYNLFQNSYDKISIDTIRRDNVYRNSIKSKVQEFYDFPNSNDVKMTKEDFINLMELVTSRTGIEKLPEAGK